MVPICVDDGQMFQIYTEQKKYNLKARNFVKYDHKEPDVKLVLSL